MLRHAFVIRQCSVIGIDKVTVDQYGINGIVIQTLNSSVQILNK